MKTHLLQYMVFCSLFICVSCNNSGLADKASGEAKESANGAASKNKAANEKTCCFIKEEDGQQFFPAGSGSIKPVEELATGSLYCSETGDSPSSFTRVYQSGNGKMTLRINDYCINPRRSEMDFERKKKNTLALYASDKQIKELTGENGLYNGFAVFSPSQKSTYLHAVVDGRFTITIAGISQESIDDVISLFGMVPIDKLAGFKK